MVRSIGISRKIPNAAALRSKAPLVNRRTPFSSGRSTCSTDRPDIGRMRTRGPTISVTAGTSSERGRGLLQLPCQTTERCAVQLGGRQHGDGVHPMATHDARDPGEVAEQRQPVGRLSGRASDGRQAAADHPVALPRVPLDLPVQCFHAAAMTDEQGRLQELSLLPPAAHVLAPEVPLRQCREGRQGQRDDDEASRDLQLDRPGHRPHRCEQQGSGEEDAAELLRTVPEKALLVRARHQHGEAPHHGEGDGHGQRRGSRG